MSAKVRECFVQFSLACKARLRPHPGIVLALFPINFSQLLDLLPDVCLWIRAAE